MKRFKLRKLHINRADLVAQGANAGAHIVLFKTLHKDHEGHEDEKKTTVKNSSGEDETRAVEGGPSSPAELSDKAAPPVPAIPAPVRKSALPLFG